MPWKTFHSTLNVSQCIVVHREKAAIGSITLNTKILAGHFGYLDKLWSCSCVIHWDYHYIKQCLYLSLPLRSKEDCCQKKHVQGYVPARSVGAGQLPNTSLPPVGTVLCIIVEGTIARHLKPLIHEECWCVSQ